MKKNKDNKIFLIRLFNILKFPLLFSIIILVTLVVLVLNNVNQNTIFSVIILLLVLYFFSIMYLSYKQSLIEITYTTFFFTLISSPLLVYAVTLFIKSNTNMIRSGSIDAWISFSGSIIGGSLVMLSLSFSMLNEKENRIRLTEEQNKKDIISLLPIIDVEPIFESKETKDINKNSDFLFSSMNNNALDGIKSYPIFKITNISNNSLSNLLIYSAMMYISDSFEGQTLDLEQLNNFNDILLPNKSIYLKFKVNQLINEFSYSGDEVEVLNFNIQVLINYDNILKSNNTPYLAIFNASYKIELDIDDYEEAFELPIKVLSYEVIYPHVLVENNEE